MEWKDYLSYILDTGKEFNDVTISLDGSKKETAIPPIIRASILLLDKMVERQGKRSIVVFPEKVQSIFLFLLMKLYHDIATERIKGAYNPSSFTPGEKLQIGNAIVEYMGCEERDKKQCLRIRTADGSITSEYLEMLPLFQRVSTKKRLSKFPQYQREKKAMVALKNSTDVDQKLNNIAEMRTHLNGSVLVMTSIANIKEQIVNCKILHKKASDIFLISQSDFEGKLSNISSGQLSGTPSIIISSDLYALRNVARNIRPHSVIIDGSNMKSLLNQLDALDDVLCYDVPVVCITDVVNSFNLSELAIRNFNTWRWDEISIAEQLFDDVPLLINRKTQNCARHAVEYLVEDGAEISSSIKLLSLHRKEIEDQPIQVMRLYEMLNELAFEALRATFAPSNQENEAAQKALNDCQTIIDEEKPYLNEDAYSDYNNAIICLRKVYTKGYIFSKNEILKEYMLNNRADSFYIIIPEKSDRSSIAQYWERWRLQKKISAHIRVLYPAEYYSRPINDCGVTIIAGWYKKAIMRKIIYSYNTSHYVVLLYDYENTWKNYAFENWKRALSFSSNKSLIEVAFSTENHHISVDPFYEPYVDQQQEEKDDELLEIENVLRDYRYRKYEKKAEPRESQPVSAIPVSFVGGLLAFYKTTHKVITVNNIINADGDKVEDKQPIKLCNGDFVVIRETSKDFVRELADDILDKSGKSNMRELAGKWREALKIDLVFSSEESLYSRMLSKGFNKGFATLKTWIEDEDMIAPQSKEDLSFLASVTENEALGEMVDQIYEAAKEVRGAHISAGRMISDVLRATLSKEIKAHEGIDQFNIWSPIDIEVEGIGLLKVLKIIDIGNEIMVDPSDTNRLIKE